MSTTLNKKTYTRLIEENISEMEKYMPEHSLEKKHAIEVLRWSIDALYEGKGFLVGRVKSKNNSLTDDEIDKKAREHLKQLNILQLKSLFQMGIAFIEIYKLGFKDGNER